MPHFCVCCEWLIEVGLGQVFIVFMSALVQVYTLVYRGVGLVSIFSHPDRTPKMVGLLHVFPSAVICKPICKPPDVYI